MLEPHRVVPRVVLHHAVDWQQQRPEAVALVQREGSHNQQGAMGVRGGEPFVDIVHGRLEIKSIAYDPYQPVGSGH